MTQEEQRPEELIGWLEVDQLSVNTLSSCSKGKEKRHYTKPQCQKDCGRWHIVGLHHHQKALGFSKHGMACYVTRHHYSVVRGS
jgi:hypothetical protein